MNRRLLNVKEVSELTGLSKNTIYCWVSQRRIPFPECGRLAKFHLQKIEKWIDQIRVQEKKFEGIRDRSSSCQAFDQKTLGMLT